jgi:GT2 family glycosyltransferase
MVTVVCLTTKQYPAMVIQGLRNQTYKDFELILADQPGIVDSMNNALKSARGDILVRIDDDVELPEKWLESLIKPFKHDYIGGVTGPTLIPWERRHLRDSIKAAEKPNWFLKWMFDWDPKACAKIYKCGSVSYGSNFLENVKVWSIQNPDHLEGTNWAMRTELIRQVGGFDPAFDGVAEWFDTDVEMKIKKLGYHLFYTPDAFLWHMVERGEHYNERFDGWGRMKNWLRFHRRHSKFHYKKVLWFLMMGAYFVKCSLRQLIRH